MTSGASSAWTPMGCQRRAQGRRGITLDNRRPPTAPVTPGRRSPEPRRRDCRCRYAATAQGPVREPCCAPDRGVPGGGAARRRGCSRAPAPGRSRRRPPGGRVIGVLHAGVPASGHRSVQAPSHLHRRARQRLAGPVQLEKGSATLEDADSPANLVVLVVVAQVAGHHGEIELGAPALAVARPAEPVEVHVANGRVERLRSQRLVGAPGTSEAGHRALVLEACRRHLVRQLGVGQLSEEDQRASTRTVARNRGESRRSAHDVRASGHANRRSQPATCRQADAGLGSRASCRVRLGRGRAERAGGERPGHEVARERHVRRSPAQP